MLPYTFEQLLTEKEVTQSIVIAMGPPAAKRAKTRLVSVVVGTVLLVLMSKMIGASVSGDVIGWIAVLCMIGLPGLMIIFHEIQRRRIIRQYRASLFSKCPLTYVISDEGVATESQDVCSKIGWVHITGYRDTPELLILRFDVQQTMTFRKSLLNDASLQIIKEKSVPF